MGWLQDNNVKSFIFYAVLNSINWWLNIQKVGLLLARFWFEIYFKGEIKVWSRKKIEEGHEERCDVGGIGMEEEDIKKNNNNT